jgi:hypothetical protein
LIRAGAIEARKDFDAVYIFDRADLERLAAGTGKATPTSPPVPPSAPALAGRTPAAEPDDAHDGAGAVDEAQPEPAVDGVDGNLAAAAFELFATGRGPREVVVALRQPPAAIRKLWAAWCEMGGDMAIPADTRRQIEALVGTISSPAALLSTIQRLVVAYRERAQFAYRCSNCGRVVLAQPGREWAAVRPDVEREWSCCPAT